MLRWSSVYFGSYQNLEWGSCSFPRCCKTATLNNINIAEFEWFAGQQSLKMQLVLSVWSEASPARTSWCSCLQSEELTEIIWPSNNPGTSRTWGMRHVGMGHRAMGHQWPEIPGHRKGFPQIPNHQPPTPTTKPPTTNPQPPSPPTPTTDHQAPTPNQFLTVKRPDYTSRRGCCWKSAQLKCYPEILTVWRDTAADNSKTKNLLS